MTDQPTPKKRGRFLRGCLIVVGAIVLLGVLAQIFGGGNRTSTSDTTAGQPSAEVAAATASSTASTVAAGSLAATPATEASEAAPASEAPAAAPADNNKGITFGEPVPFSAGGLTTIGLLVTNTTDQVKSFTVKATYKTGDAIAATAVGAVNDLRAGQTRAVTLLSQDKIPDTFDSVRVDVDTMIIEAQTTPNAEVATKLQFGQPNIRSTAGFSTADVEVTNTDSKAHSLTVQAIFTKDGKLVGIGTGAVNDLAAGQTKTASLIIQGQVEGADVDIVPDTIVQ